MSDKYTTEELLRAIEEIDAHICEGRVIDKRYNEEYCKKLDAIRSIIQAAEPRALSLEEFWGMENQWVCLLFPDKQCGDALCTKFRSIYGEYAHFYDNGRHTNFFVENYGKTWLAYTAPPVKGEA